MLDFLQGFLGEDFPTKNLIVTFITVISLVILQKIFLRYMSKKKWASESIYLRVHAHVRNAFLMLITISIVTIWIPQIQSFALSVAAIAVAIVVSLKEIITMLTGGIIRSSTDLLRIGNRIEVNKLKGDVVRIGFLTTDLLEIGDCGQKTGRIIHIPNSFFFTCPVINEAAVKDFTFHILTLPIASEKYSLQLKEELLAFIKDISNSYIFQATEQFQKFSRQNALTGINTEPRILLKVHTFEEYELILRIPIPIHDKIKIEQKILQKFTELCSESNIE